MSFAGRTQQVLAATIISSKPSPASCGDLIVTPMYSAPIAPPCRVISPDLAQEVWCLRPSTDQGPQFHCSLGKICASPCCKQCSMIFARGELAGRQPPFMAGCRLSGWPWRPLANSSILRKNLRSSPYYDGGLLPQLCIDPK